MPVMCLICILSCKKDTDEEVPTIEVSSFNEFENDTVYVEQDLILDLSYAFADDEGLNSMRISIDQKSSSVTNCERVSAYEERVISDLSGTSDSFHFTTILPDSLVNNLDITCEVFDDAGNLKSERITAVIANTLTPEIISLTSVPESSSCTISLVEEEEIGLALEASSSENISTVNIYSCMDEEISLINSLSGFNDSYVNENFNLNVTMDTEALTLKIQISSESGISTWSTLEVVRE